MKISVVCILVMALSNILNAQNVKQENAGISYKAESFEKYKQIPEFVPAYFDKNTQALAVNAADVKLRNKYAAAKKVFEGKEGYYEINLHTIGEEDGESNYKIKIGDSYVK